MEQDGEEDFFFALEDLEGPVVPMKSSKKRKIEDVEECSSHSFA